MKMIMKQLAVFLVGSILMTQLTQAMAQEKTEPATQQVGMVQSKMIGETILKSVAGENNLGEQNTINDSMLKEAITKVKEKFIISDKLTEFNYNVEASDKITYWQFSWHDKEYSENMDIRYGSDGNVYQYFHNTSEFPYNERKKLSTITKQDATVKAENFLKKALPEEYSNFKEYDNEQLQPIYEYGNYSIRYQYYKNGILVSGVDSFVNINAITGIVTNYNTSGNFTLNYPVNENIIDSKNAEEAYKSEIGVKLIYRAKMKYDKDGATIEKIYPVYVPKYEYEYGIDAKTGKRVSLFDNYSLPNYPYYKDAYGGKEMYRSSMAMDQSIKLLPSEENAIKDMEGIIAKAEAIKIIDQKSIPGLDRSYTLNSSNLSKGYVYGNNSYLWNFTYIKQVNGTNKEKSNSNNEKMVAIYDEPNENIFITMDAKSGEILSFGANNILYDSRVGTSKLEDVQKEVEGFLKVFVGDKYNQIVMEQNEQISEAYKKEPVRFMVFNYIRNVDGVAFPENNIILTYDTLQKRITSYSLTWFNADFPVLKGALNKDSIYEKLFQGNPIELQYRVIYRNEKQNNVLLIYNPNGEKPMIIDPFTGKRLDYNGDEFDIVTNRISSNYTDIEDHFAQKHISELALIGIGFSGDEFKPNEEITQKDFMLLISQTFSYNNYLNDSSEKWDDEKINNLYLELIRRGIILESEKAPDKTVAREDAVKYLVRGLGLGKIADKGEIFIKEFIDSSDISPANVGYVAIAKALNIANGNSGSFHPKRILTKGEAAVMIYGYLTN